MNLIELAILYRAINIYIHNAHNLCKGDTFLQDHAFLGELYPIFDDFYDQCIERHIGTVDDKIDVVEITKKSIALLEGENGEYFNTILASLKNACEKIEKLSKTGISGGTINLIQGQQDQIEVLIYKIKRKLGER